MLVFIDESGDPGFKLNQGSSRLFVAAMIIFQNSEDARSAQEALECETLNNLKKSEFKFSRCGDDIRDKYFEVARDLKFLIRAIVVQKNLIHSPRLKADKERFYEYFVHQMIKRNDGRLFGAKVIIDGSGDREFKQNLNAALRKKTHEGAVKSVTFKDSRSDCLIQLADMCVGAIARSYRDDRTDSRRWRDMISARIDDVWSFK